MQDCSGFVQSIYSAYGYSIPRVAEVQAQYGMQIPVSEAKPGDLILYAKDGAVYHVVMYMGDGKTIEAANSNQGIICSVVDTAHAVWATRIISDSDSDKIEQVNDNAARGVSYTKAKAGDSGNYLEDSSLPHIAAVRSAAVNGPVEPQQAELFRYRDVPWLWQVCRSEPSW